MLSIRRAIINAIDDVNVTVSAAVTLLPSPAVTRGSFMNIWTSRSSSATGPLQSSPLQRQICVRMMLMVCDEQRLSLMAGAPLHDRLVTANSGN